MAEAVGHFGVAGCDPVRVIGASKRGKWLFSQSGVVGITRTYELHHAGMNKRFNKSHGLTRWSDSSSYNCPRIKRTAVERNHHFHQQVSLMKAMTRVASRVMIGAAAMLCFVPSHAAVIFKDDFELGNLSKTLSGAKWNASTKVTVSTGQAKSGSYAAKFEFTGNTSLAAAADAFSELRFDLGVLNTDVWLQYDLYIPANYVHRDAESSDNNKLFRLWGNTYDDVEKVGFSMWPYNGYSSLGTDWNIGTGIGPKGVGANNFITAADLGKWMTVKIRAKAATATLPGTLNVWKNGTLVIDNTNKVNNYRSGESHAFRYGYLLGWSNSGFTQTTNLYIDNVVFGTLESDLGSTSTSPAASPPSPPSLIVK